MSPGARGHSSAIACGSRTAAYDEHAGALLEQRAQQVGRVSRRTRGDDIARVGHRDAAEACVGPGPPGPRRSRSLASGNSGGSSCAARPAHLGELVGDALGCIAITVGDRERRPAQRRVVVPRVDHERRRRQHVAGALDRAHAAEHRAHRRQEVDGLAAAEQHRQRAPRHHRLALAEHGRDRELAGLVADARVIAVRVGLVRDDRVGDLDAVARQVAVEVVRDHERRAADHACAPRGAAATRDRRSRRRPSRRGARGTCHRPDRPPGAS